MTTFMEAGMLRRFTAALVGAATIMAGLAAPAMAVTGGDPVPSGSAPSW